MIQRLNYHPTGISLAPRPSKAVSSPVLKMYTVSGTEKKKKDYKGIFRHGIMGDIFFLFAYFKLP